MEKQSKPECIVEAVPEDPSRPDGPTDLYLVLDGRRIAVNASATLIRRVNSAALGVVTEVR